MEVQHLHVYLQRDTFFFDAALWEGGEEKKFHILETTSKSRASGFQLKKFPTKAWGHVVHLTTFTVICWVFLLASLS